jgi:hypothetical protein
MLSEGQAGGGARTRTGALGGLREAQARDPGHAGDQQAEDCPWGPGSVPLAWLFAVIWLPLQDKGPSCSCSVPGWSGGASWSGPLGAHREIIWPMLCHPRVWVWSVWGGEYPSPGVV